MSKYNQRDLYLILRNDFHVFMKKAFRSINPGEKLSDNWHLRAITHHFDLCLQGQINRLLITVSPRSLKSHIGSVCFPAFLLGQNPATKIICASYSQILSEDFSNQCRLLMSEPWYKDVFPSTVLSPIKNTASEFDTTIHGKRIATSLGGTLTGRGGDFIIIDDINKAADFTSASSRETANQWFDNTLQSRLNSMKEGCIIVIQQRIHTDDLAGHILKKGDWVHLNLPAIAQEEQIIAINDDGNYHFKKDELLHEARLDRDNLEQQRKNVGSYIFSSQYLQSPVPEEGNLVPVEAFRNFDNYPIHHKEDLIVHSWDIASGQGEHNDYSVGTIWLYRYNEYFLLDVVRRKLSYNELRIEVRRQAQESNVDVLLIEKAGVGIALIDDLKQGTKINIIAIVPTKDKVTRMVPGTADIEAGKVALPKDALWRAEFEKECAEFPYGKHDDQVDSLSMFLDWARKRRETGQDYAILSAGLDALIRPPAPTEIRTKEDIKNLLWPNVSRRKKGDNDE